MAAYMEVKNAAKERKTADAKEAAAEKSKTAYLKAKSEMESQSKEAAEFRIRAVKDGKAAMEEVKAAARSGSKMGQADAALEHGLRDKEEGGGGLERMSSSPEGEKEEEGEEEQETEEPDEEKSWEMSGEVPTPDSLSPTIKPKT